MINQDIDGSVPADPVSGAGAAPAGAPDSLEQQLAKEREARALMRDRLRHTEALAAESHALRARMAQELERVTADRDRLRTEASTAAAPSGTGTAAKAAARPMVEPPMTPRMSDLPLKPPAPRRAGPWRALAMLGGLAAAIAALAWITGTLPGDKELQAMTGSASTPAPIALTAAASQPSLPATLAAPATVAATPSSSAATVAAAAPSDGAVALPPITPEAQLAAAPTAAGPPPAGAAPSGIVGRLRTALDGEGIASGVDVDSATGHVMVADPQASDVQRERTDMLIRAVYAGASLPEPQIEHRWLSPSRAARLTVTSAATPPAGPTATLAAAAAGWTRHAAEPRGKPSDLTVADAEELRPVLPSGRVTASCMDTLGGKSTVRRAGMTACMKHSCCSSAANHNSEECRAYDKAYPFTCSAG